MVRDEKTIEFDKMIDKRELRLASIKLYHAKIISKETHWDYLEKIDSGQISYN